MCSAPLRELSNPGASGSIFYLTDDDEFIIKTVQHKEGEFLQTLLPGYYMVSLTVLLNTTRPYVKVFYCFSLKDQFLSVESKSKSEDVIAKVLRVVLLSV